MARQEAGVEPRAIRLAHIVSHPIPYFAALYRELDERPEVDLTVFFASDISVREYEDPGFGRAVEWDTPLLEGYRHRFLPSAQGRNLTGSKAIYRPSTDIIRAVAREPFDAVWVHGYANVNGWLALAATKLRGRTFIVRDEPTLAHSRSGWKRALKYPLLRAVFTLSAALYIGEQNRRYLRHYGMPEERMFPARYCVDNRFFQARAAELEPKRDEIRRSFGIDDDGPVIMFSGKLIPKKQPLRIIEAFGELRRQRRAWLLVVGDGELREEAERLVAERGIENVVFAGFLNQTELPRAYTATDAFVLFSSDFETWGLVVNEAMNFSLPVVVSDKVGCGDDLVEPGGNGWVVPHDDVPALTDALERVIADPERMRALGARSREIVDDYSVERCADGIVQAVSSLVGKRVTA